MRYRGIENIRLETTKTQRRKHPERTQTCVARSRSFRLTCWSGTSFQTHETFFTDCSRFSERVCSHIVELNRVGCTTDGTRPAYFRLLVPNSIEDLATRRRRKLTHRVNRISALPSLQTLVVCVTTSPVVSVLRENLRRRPSPRCMLTGPLSSLPPSKHTSQEGGSGTVADDRTGADKRL